MYIYGLEAQHERSVVLKMQRQLSIVIWSLRIGFYSIRSSWKALKSHEWCGDE